MKIFKVLLILVSVAGTILLTVALSLPTIASTEKGKKFLVENINMNIPGNISIGKLELAWRGPSQVANIELFDKNGVSLLKVDKIDLKTPLLTFITAKNPEPQIELSGLNATIVSDIHGLTNIEQALSIEASNRPQQALLEAILIENVSIKTELLDVLNRLKIQAEGSTIQGSLKGSFDINGDLGDQTNLQLNATKLPVLLLDQIVRLNEPRFGGALLALLGEEMSIHVKVDNDLIDQQFSTPFMNATFKGSFENNMLITSEPIKVDWTITPQNFDHLAKILDLDPSLHLLANTNLSLSSSNLKLDTQNPEKSSGSVNGHVTNLKSELIDLPSFDFGAQFDPKNEGVVASLKGKGSRLNQPFEIQGEVVLPKNDHASSWIELFEKDTRFKIFLVDGQQQISVNSVGSIQNKVLTAEGSIKFKENALDQFHLSTSPLSWDKILKGDTQDLQTQVNLSVAKISGAKRSISLPTSQWNIAGSGKEINGRFTLAGKEIKLEGKVDSTSGGNRINFSLNQLQGAGKLNIEGEVLNAFSNERSVVARGDLEDFSVETLNAYLPLAYSSFDPTLQNKLQALFGSGVNGHFQTNLTKMAGPLSFSAKGDNVEVDFEGNIHQGNLFLSRPLTAHLVLTREVSEQVLSTLLPLLNSAVKADEPLRLTISEKGFRLPIQDFNIANLALPSATLDLGKIHFSREGKLAQVFSLLNIKQSEIFSVWFTPLYFSLFNGKLKLERLDMLVADKYPLTTWGSIDFIKDFVAMEVGITGQTLSNSFGGIALPKNTMIAIPLRGPVKKPKLDTTKVAAKLAALAAMTTGPQGVLIGGLIHLASGTLTEKIPPPTTDPLPWKVDAPEPAEGNSDASPIKALEETKPVKEIKKGAKKLLNSIFKNP